MSQTLAFTVFNIISFFLVFTSFKSTLLKWILQAVFLGTYLYFLEPFVTGYLGGGYWGTVASVFVGLFVSFILSTLLARRGED